MEELKPILCEAAETLCDGLDDDCDGTIDMLVEPCSSACGSGSSVCRSGKWSACDAPPVYPETCNRVDDDCDGKTDEDLEVRPCYPRNQLELLFGECRFGIDRCVSGTYGCRGWIGPAQETCNGLDDDCDGAVDEDVHDDLDLVLVLDYSGSMVDVLEHVVRAVEGWSRKYDGQPGIMIAAVGVPPDVGPGNMYPELMTPLLDPGAFSTFISTRNKYGYGWAEPTMDALWLLSQPGDLLGIGWTPGANRTAVVFTDENPQTYRSPPVDPAQLRAQCASAGLDVYVSTDEPTWSAWGPTPMGDLSGIERLLDEAISKGRCR